MARCLKRQYNTNEDDHLNARGKCADGDRPPVNLVLPRPREDLPYVEVLVSQAVPLLPLLVIDKVSEAERKWAHPYVAKPFIGQL